MAIYKIEWKASALRELKKLDRSCVPRIVEAVESLASNPFPPGVKKLHGGNVTYRMRVGDYRVIYDLFYNRLVVQIVRVRHRKNAYRS